MDESELTIATRSQLVHDLRELGLQPGQVVMLHASVKAAGWIVGGPDAIIQALLDVLTPGGTLMIYVSWEEWERYLRDGVARFPEDRRQAYLDECPPFEVATSRANRKWSILTEYFRTWPNARRSDHPTASVVAVGAQAEWITADHPLEYGYGPGSPLEKLCRIGGQVLLLGAPLSKTTLLHHAEHLARLPDKRVVRNSVPVLREGRREWIEIEEFDTCEGIVDQAPDGYFEDVVRDYLSSGRGKSGKVGAAQSYLLEAADLTEFAVGWMERTFG